MYPSMCWENLWQGEKICEKRVKVGADFWGAFGQRSKRSKVTNKGTTDRPGQIGCDGGKGKNVDGVVLVVSSVAHLI